MNTQTKFKTGETMRRVITLDQANARFALANQPSKDEASFLREFLVIISRVCDMTRGSFSINDVILHNASFQIPGPILTDLFQKWSEKMVQYGKLEIVNGVYDTPIFILI